MSEQHDAAHAGRVEAHRLDGFIDAAFAFAVSVLAIAGAEVPHSMQDLVSALDRIPAFACSFATLMIFWHRHVRWRDRFRLHDTTSLMLSLTLVFFALIFVYPLNMLFQAMFGALYATFAHQELSGTLVIGSVRDVKALYLCYGLAYACMAACLACLYRHSLRHARLSQHERIDAREVLYTQAASVGVAVLSLLATMVIPETAAWTTVPGVIYALLTPTYWIAGRWAHRAKARII